MLLDLQEEVGTSSWWGLAWQVLDALLLHSWIEVELVAGRASSRGVLSAIGVLGPQRKQLNWFCGGHHWCSKVARRRQA